MKLFNKAYNNFVKFKLFKPYEFILLVLLFLYIISGVSTPYSVSPYVNNYFMYLSLLALSFLLYLYGNPLVALVFIFTSYVFIQRSKYTSHELIKPSQNKTDSKLKELNSNLKEKTLEEEIVGKIVRNNDNLPNVSNYNPVLCDNHNAYTI
tara:strand:- start:26912 stop:27364 length:453 start_codon:yes stop_codon:yes gene_type:complete